MNSLIRTVRSKSINAEQTRFQSEQESCVLCDTKLEVRAERVATTTPDGMNKSEIVRETAECPKCRVRARSKDHQLQ
jgi:uncharacterized protein with PIN domain